ncbi:hypothetical protein AeNC1_011334 [Aphanomyces euteiches]|nr:hypothetical protein AeNC1_011334 [Aphanomyces euteiches]
MSSRRGYEHMDKGGVAVGLEYDVQYFLLTAAVMQARIMVIFTTGERALYRSTSPAAFGFLAYVHRLPMDFRPGGRSASFLVPALQSCFNSRCGLASRFNSVERQRRLRMGLVDRHGGIGIGGCNAHVSQQFVEAVAGVELVVGGRMTPLPIVELAAWWSKAAAWSKCHATWYHGAIIAGEPIDWGYLKWYGFGGGTRASSEEVGGSLLARCYRKIAVKLGPIAEELFLAEVTSFQAFWFLVLGIAHEDTLRRLWCELVPASLVFNHIVVYTPEDTEFVEFGAMAGQCVDWCGGGSGAVDDVVLDEGGGVHGLSPPSLRQSRMGKHRHDHLHE